jgi:hypothetical protein
VRNLFCALTVIYAACCTLTAGAATLEGFARLTADTLMPGPDSGHFIEADESLDLPFRGQPAQGFSAIVSNTDGGYLTLVDNGFGSRNNSPDFLLRIYFLSPDFRSTNGGTGEIVIEGFINLSDPAGFMPYPVTAERQCLGAPEPCIAVDPAVRSERLLTGADLDPESMQVSEDGSFWIGDELGPYLLHFDQDGILMESPIELHGLVSDSRPGALESTRTLRRSRGFESLALDPSADILYPMLEGALHSQPGQLNIYTFDIESRSYLNPSAMEPSFKYRPDPLATAVGTFKMVDEDTALVLERDSGEGSEAVHKKLYRVHFSVVDEAGFLVRTEVADLLNINDPLDLNADGETSFGLPMTTLEGLVILDDGLVGIISDNNYPFGKARGEAAAPEATEFILLRLDDQP